MSPLRPLALLFVTLTVTVGCQQPSAEDQFAAENAALGKNQAAIEKQADLLQAQDDKWANQQMKEFGASGESIDDNNPDAIMQYPSE